MAVERAEVVDAQLVEERAGLHHLPHRGLGGPHGAAGQVAHPGDALKHFANLVVGADIAGVHSHPQEALRQPGDGGGIRPPVVVEHDGHVAARVPDVVEPLEGHPSGQRAVAHHCDDPALLAAGGLLGGGEAVGVAQHGGGVAVLDPVVGGLFPARVARQAAGLAQRLELVGAAGEHLVHIGLVAGVPQDDVPGRVEHPVEGQRELHYAQIGAQVTSGGVHRLNDELADLLGQLGQFLFSEAAKVGWAGDLLKVVGVHVSPIGLGGQGYPRFRQRW